MSTATRLDFELALVAWLEAAQGWTVILEDEDGPRPDAEYITAKVTTLARIGTAERRTDDIVSGDEFRGRVQVHHRGTAEVVAYGRGARARLELLRTSIDLPAIHELNAAVGLYLVSSTDTLDTTEPVGVASLPRFTTDFFFHWSTLTDFESYVIETVDITQG